jgi:fatty-acyl-CoA synthase
LPAAASAALAAKQGRPIYGMEFAICDDERREVAHGGVAFGSMPVRGPWVAASYYREAPTRIPARAGWFDTGDVITMDADGYVQIDDRTKNVIKSDGEGISSSWRKSPSPIRQSGKPPWSRDLMRAGASGHSWW